MKPLDAARRALKGLRIVMLAAVALTVAAASHAANHGGERRTALVIGNANYPYQPLRNPVNDARAMADRLTSLGFEVMLVENATRLKMQQSILEFGEKLSQGGVGLFYYAGHGLQVRGNNYIVPLDENIRSEASVRFEAIDMGAVLEEMSQPRPDRTNIVILDACRNNPYASRYGGNAAGLAMMDAPVDFLIGYATAPGAVAVDGDQDHGIYTGALVKAMSEPDLKVEDMFKRVRAEVSRQTRYAQIPWEASSLVRDFSFHLPNQPAAPTVVAEASPIPESNGEERGVRSSRESQAAELAFWDSIKNSKNAADYEAYLEAFPEGIFAPLAKARARRFDKPAAPQVSAPRGPAIEEIESYYTARVASNLRQAPTASSQRVGRVDAGARLLATGKVKDANWYRVETEEGTSGFVFGDLIARETFPNLAAQVKAAKTAPKPVPQPATQPTAPTPAPASAATTTAAVVPIPEPVPSITGSRRAERVQSPAPVKTAVAATTPPAAPAPETPSVTAAPAKVEVPKISTPAPTPSPPQEKPAPQPAAKAAAPASSPATAQPIVAPQVARVQPPKIETPPAPAASAEESFQDCDYCPRMVVVPAGRFVMGERRGHASERPAHPVSIGRSFAIGAREVTLGEWKACVKGGACDHQPKPRGGSDDTPVHGVSWNDAQQYVRWLAKVTNRPYRLPSEAEWEYAARAQTESRYWWGSAVGSGRANCKDCGGDYARKYPAAAGSFAANPFGLHDTSGGVWEWVEDCWHADYEGAPRDGSVWRSSNCGQRVLRGGSWRNDSSYLHSASRFFYDASVRYSANGFRVALTLR